MTLRNKVQSAIRHIWPPEPKPLILMYHRIADDPIDNWRLSVSPAHFEEQLQVLRRNRRPVQLADFVSDLCAGTLPNDAVALTFDDGYVDNLIVGKPRLAAAAVPATVFVATGYLDHACEFWWDELARLILLESGPKNFELVVKEERITFDLSSSTASDDGTTRAASLTKRKAVLTAIWQILQRLEGEERELIMVELRAICSGRNNYTVGSRAMTRDEVRALASDGLVTIGAHTVTHPLLSELEGAACYREIAESKLTCEALIGAPVVGFAYPYGDIDSKAREAVRISGFTFACSSRHEPIVATSDVFALPRLHVHNWDGDAFEQALCSASAKRVRLTETSTNG
jgi:peptidoglycan/xylan/chitin deacetylase (PgdA/CDA1 family)